jgi:hypothetical protein
MLVCASAALLRADALWLAADPAAATPGATVTIDAAAGAEFGSPNTPLSATRVQSFFARLGSVALAPAPSAPGSQTTGWRMSLSAPGVVVLELLLAPEARSIARAEVVPYLRSIRASADVRAAWTEIPAPAPWLEVRRIRAKAYVRAGQPAASEAAWRRTTGEALDLAPDRDPTRLVAGDAIGFLVTRGGVPVPGAMVEFLSWGETHEHVAAADAAGRVEASLEVPGLWLVRCTEVSRVQASNHEWETDVCSVTLSVR